ncbi:hemolysin XhlA family protein [Ensifer sp. NBAIM29]|nr:hemolysin XhlA family protein [Ensifer sp. NBAIM29]
MTDLNHLQGRIDEAHQRLDKMGDRVTALEKDGAVTEVRMATIQQSLGKIESTTGWVLKIVLGGIITAIIAFIVRGGLNG